jgi:CDP-glycerol glycerophosphotransferase
MRRTTKPAKGTSVRREAWDDLVATAIKESRRMRRVVRNYRARNARRRARAAGLDPSLIGASDVPDFDTRYRRELRSNYLGEKLRYASKDRTEPAFHYAALSARVCETLPIDDDLVMYEAYNGRDFAGNPHALLRYLLEDDRYAHLRHVVAVNDVSNPIASRYAAHPRVRIVEVHSDEYIECAHTCRYFVNNASWKGYIVKRPGQIYVTSWHSTLLKRLARDAGAPWDAKNVSRSLVASDFFLSPNGHTTEHLLRSHDVHGIFPGLAAEVGYPRNDLIVQTDVTAIRRRLGLGPDEQLVLYAPTWRGSYTPEDTVEESLAHLRAMRAAVPAGVRLFVKFHTLVFAYLEGHDVPDMVPVDLDTNEILAATDVLVTDYSGIFFDYLVTGRPIVFFMPDLEAYERAKGGFYLDISELPGPRCDDPTEAGNLIGSAARWQETFAATYEDFRQRFVANDDGKACQRAVELIFEGGQRERCRTFLSDKPRLLFYAANLAGNGVTESLLALLRHLDYTRYEVVIQLPDDGKYRENQLRIDPRARIFYQNAQDGYTQEEFLKLRLVEDIGVRSVDDVPHGAFRRTERRIFGDLDFDTVINFNGYFPVPAAKFATGPVAKRRLIYLHNDLERDRQIKHPQLHAVFSTYQLYDRLICVSRDSLADNVRGVGAYMREAFGYDVTDRMSYARNLVDLEAIESRARQGGIVHVEGEPTLVVPGGQDRVGLGVPFRTEDRTNFVAVGRLSPEKNHERLLHAFASVVRVRPDVHLYIVGTGKLDRELRALCEQLHLEDYVTFTGFLANPLPLVSRADCLVSASDIEGQPITILEALVLQRPVIATDIAGPRGLLEDGHGLLVERTSAALAEAMVKFAGDRRAFDFTPFDAVEYVERALAEFYAHLNR